MGQVFRARDTKLDRVVAIKILPDAFANDIDRLARFQREAKTLASLNHPHIAAIYGLEESAGVTALVMELVEGEDLSQRIDRGAIPLDEALPIARQIAEALEAAHEQGIVHRDLKPANIKVRPDGTVKVLDFGLAKALGPAEAGPHTGDRGIRLQPDLSQSPTITTPAMTQAGMILGTAAYMSPEQARGRAVDKRADIWAFGCVVFEMLSGRRVFEAEDVSLTLAEVMKSDPDWSALPAAVSPSLQTVLRRCLSKDPRQRIRDIGDVRLALDGAFETASERTPAAAPVAVPTSLWKRAFPAVASAIVVASVAAVVFSVSRPSESRSITRFSYPLPEGQAFQNTGRQAVAISSDGTKVLYLAGEQLLVRSLSDGEPRPVGGVRVIPGEGTNPVFSPDGRSIVFRSGADSTLKKIAVDGGAAVTICPADAPAGMSWGSEGILFGQREGIMRVSPNGGTPERLVSVEADERADGPQMLPGGDVVMFTLAKGTATDRWDKARVIVQRLKSGERKTLIEGGSDARYVSTGHLLYALSGTVFAVPFDVERLEVTGGPVPIIEGVLRSGNNGPTGIAHFGVSNNGTLVYVPGPVSTSIVQSTLEIVDRKGTIEPLKLPASTYDHPRVSPDGKHLAYVVQDLSEDNVWTYDLSGVSAPRRLTFGGTNRFPIWSSDSQRVAFQSNREGDLGIFWQRGDGTDQPTRLTKPEPGTTHAPESWSPDGQHLLFRVTKGSSGSSLSVWVFSMKDKTTVRFDAIESTTPTNATFSPDGRWVAYNVIGGSASGATGLFVQPFPATGAKYEISGRAAIHPLWAADGKELIFALPGQALSVPVTTQPAFAIGNPVIWMRVVLSTIGPTAARQWDMMPDGRVLGIATAASATARELRVVLNWTDELKTRVPKS